MTKEELEKENAELQEENGKLLQRIAQLEKDVTENESDCSMCDFPKLKQDLEKEKCELLGIIQGKDTAIQDLQKENTELKEELKDADEKIVHLACNQNKDLKYKLTEAKEIIDAFLDFESSCQERGIYISDGMREWANKFLEEE